MAGLDTYVKLLLHCDGSDASTTFTDSSSAARAMTAVANAQIDTAQSKFGGASGLWDGTGDAVTAVDSADWDFGNGDFTIDCWLRFNNKATNVVETIVAQYASLQKAFAFDYYDTGHNLRFVYTTDGTTDIVLQVSWTPSNATWYHVAVTRNGANLRFFVDGTQVGATQNISTDTIFNSNQVLGVGANSGTLVLDGWLDEVRISKGIARWTANFTPPTAAYGPISQAITQATETDTANAFTHVRGKSIGQATETDSAQAMAWAPKKRLVTQATETDTSQAIRAQRSRAIGQPSETDTATAFTLARRKAITQATETDSVISLTIARRKSIGQATETDSVLSINRVRRVPVDQAEETDEAQMICVYIPGRSIETLTATANSVDTLTASAATTADTLTPSAVSADTLTLLPFTDPC